MASALWAAFPSLIGPFPPNGATPGSVSMQASVVTRQFDRAVTSSTGDPLLGTVYANAPAATPVTLAPGASVTLKVTIKPTAGVGSQVRGTLFVDVLQPGGAAGLSSYADAIAALPYAYTVKTDSAAASRSRIARRVGSARAETFALGDRPRP